MAGPRGHVHYPIQYFSLPISTFLITSFQFGYFSFPILSFSLLTSNLGVSYFQFPIFSFITNLDNYFNLGKAFVSTCESASAAGLLTPFTCRISEVNCEVKSRWQICLGDRMLI